MSLISQPLAFLYNIQGGQLLLIIIVMLVLFGGRRLPEMARSLGKAVNEFRRAATEISQDVTVAQTPPPAKPATETAEKVKEETAV